MNPFRPALQGSRQPSRRIKPSSRGRADDVTIAPVRKARWPRFLAGAALVALLASPALAAEHACVTAGSSLDGVCSETLAASSGPVLKPSTTAGGYRAITFDNESTTATIAVCLGASCTAAINTGGSFTIPPGQTRTWSVPYGAGGGFNDPWNAISSVASITITVQAQ